MSVSNRDRDSATRYVYWLLLAGTLGVALVTFTLSFVGLRDYGIRLMGLPVALGPLVPLGVDVFSLIGVAATYLLRQAPWHVRVYAWCVFLVPSALSIAGNLAHADVRHLPASGMVGAGVAPVLLALAAHLVVVVRRHRDGDSGRTPVRDSVELSADRESEQVNPRETLSAGEAPRQQERRPANATPDDVRTAALAALVAGATYDEAAASAGVSVRTVQRWHDDTIADVKTRSRRARIARRSGQRPDGTADSTPTSGAPVGNSPSGADAEPMPDDAPRQREAPGPDARINGAEVPALITQT